jgi:hypothetical protein
MGGNGIATEQIRSETKDEMYDDLGTWSGR